MNKVQILLYTSYLHIIGGIETFVMNFIDLMGDKYEIGVMCNRMPTETAQRIGRRAKVFRYEPVICDTLIMVRMGDPIPGHIQYERSIRMCHAMKTKPTWNILQDCERVVNVSKASKKSFGGDGMVIYNPLTKTEKKAILLVSATRIPALDKGKNADRMLKLADMLNKKDIPFLWLNFSDAPLQNAPKGFVNVGTYQDLQPYIARADYLVQLSDHEGFGYSVLEALMNGTAVICTPFETTAELGVIDGQNGYIIPYNMDFDVDKLLTVPAFEYKWDNAKIKKEWEKLLKAKPRQKKRTEVMVEVIRPYKDLERGKLMRKGEVFCVDKARAKVLTDKDLVKVAQ